MGKFQYTLLCKNQSVRFSQFIFIKSDARCAFPVSGELAANCSSTRNRNRPRFIHMRANKIFAFTFLIKRWLVFKKDEKIAFEIAEPTRCSLHHRRKEALWIRPIVLILKWTDVIFSLKKGRTNISWSILAWKNAFNFEKYACKNINAICIAPPYRSNRAICSIIGTDSI